MDNDEFLELTEYFVMERMSTRYYLKNEIVLKPDLIRGYLEDNWDKFQSKEYVLCKRLEVDIQVSIKGE